MKPVDPRLLRYARATRGFLLASIALGLAGAGLVVAQAVLLADAITTAFQHGAVPYHALTLLAATAVGRAAVAWLTELAAHHACAAVTSELRLRLVAHTAATRDHRTGEMTALITRGIDALDDYFARYLPQLALAVVVPATVLARIVVSDWISALTIAVTLPLIPLFMILIGWATQSRMDRQWRLLARLSHHFLDVVAGLPTLKVFGRAHAQAQRIRGITTEYRQATLRTLRLAFLSSFALELLSTISVALVAVGVGMRLVHGDLDLHTGLVVLILAPEAYLPLRQVGAQYHAAAEGLTAAGAVFDVLERPLPLTGTTPAPVRNGATLSLRNVSVRHDGRTHDALPPTSLTLQPGHTLALAGPSGAGKSTLLHLVLGLARPTTGQIRLDGTELAEIDPPTWHSQIAWVPQHPHLFAGTIADNVRLPHPDATDEQVNAALHAAAASGLDPATLLGEQGAGLSAGQAQRVALARAFLADRPVVILDEPTAALDGTTEQAVVAAIARLTADRTALIVAHRPALLHLADHVHTLPPPPDHTAPPRNEAREEPQAEGEPHAEPGPRVPARAGATPSEPPHPPDEATATTATTAREGPARARPLARVRTMARPLTSRFALALLLATLALGSAVGLMATSGWLISRASQQPPVLYLMVAVTATRAFGIGRAVFRYAERLVSHDAVLRLLADIRVTVYRRLERLAPAGLTPTRRGDLLTRLVTDVDTLQDYFLRWLLPVGTALTVSLAAAGFTTALLPEAGAVLAAGLALAGIATPAVTSALSRRTERRLAPARAALATRVLDLLSGTSELTVAGALPARTEAVRTADAHLTRLTARSAARGGIAAGLNALVTGLTTATAAWVGAAAVTGGRLDGVLLAVVTLTSLAAFEAVTGLPQAVQYRQRTKRSAERVQEVLDTPAPVREPADARAEPANELAARWRHGARETGRPKRPGQPEQSENSSPANAGPRLLLRGVEARYPGQDASRPAALADFDLDLAPGRRVAIVGPSGSGKTTVAQILLRFLDPTQGSYTLTGPQPETAGRDAVEHAAAELGAAGLGAAELDASAQPSDAVRRLVGLCAQDAHLFDSTLRENLRLAQPEATDADLHVALAAARLEGWVTTSLPDGLDTDVGELGARLSGGQRQRLALARALLADFPVLVLDEPAEHLDLPTADALTADLLTATEGRTTVLITHRLTGLESVDEVIVLDGGRVVERGPYELLAAATADGPFRRMLDREATVGTGALSPQQPLDHRRDSVLLV